MSLKLEDITLVDIMVLSTQSFIAQITSILTKKRYKYATVFVNNASKLGFVYL